ncbi:MAG: sigma-70 family RNA polymerase sigma factor [Lachnospiraceae bacterium]|nr:sigma-70 family RNA polymerase sigma factor [Lachnospiraceae bacterium]
MAELDFQYIAELVVQAREGSSDAFAELYAATYQKEYHFALNYLKDSYLAQDALQETYISVLKNLKTLNDPKLFVSWLNQICFRICFDMHKKQTRSNDLSVTLKEGMDCLLEERTPEDQVVTIDHNQFLIRQVMNLPFSESQAIIFRYYENMKVDDIAAYMDISKSSVKRYLRSGLGRLKQALKA